VDLDTSTALPIAEALPAMQSLASRIWSPQARHHPGQLAWGYAYGLPEVLGHGPAVVLKRDEEVVAWAWAEADDWMELCVDPAAHGAGDDAIAWFLDRAGDRVVRTMTLHTEEHVIASLDRAGFVVEDAPWFTHHLLDLVRLVPVPAVPGYRFRHVEANEAAARAACHRAAWTPPGGASRVVTEAYERLMATPPYRRELDWVAIDQESGEMVASCLVWLDESTHVALVEPVGCAPEHRGRGLAGAVSLAALAAARERGATHGLVCPRGDDGYPVPARVYQRIGFVPGPRTITFVRPVLAG
jgi:GNAT superfamily N-acetyltransferase